MKEYKEDFAVLLDTEEMRAGFTVDFDIYE